MKTEKQQSGISVGIDQGKETKNAGRELRGPVGKIHQLLARIAKKNGMIPVCSSCNCVRDDRGVWHRVESHIYTFFGAEFTHGLCPDCARELYPWFGNLAKCAG